jgi:Tol biopolymer transport system component
VVQDVQSGSSKRLTTRTGNDATPSWSHDGKWIYFCSERIGGDQIWRMPAEGGPAKQLTAHGGWAPEESADGRYLFYTKSKLNGIWRMPLSGNEDEQVVSNVAGAGTSYGVGRRGIYFIELPNGGRRQHLAFLSFATGQVISLANIPYKVDMGLTISRDEQTLLYSQMDHVNSDLMLVEHFH